MRKIHSSKGIRKDCLPKLEIEHMEIVDTPVSDQIATYKNSTNKKFLRKVVRWKDILNYDNGRELSEDAITLAIAEVEEWIEQCPDAIMFEEFLVERKVGDRLWRSWCDKDSRLAEVYEWAKMVIGVRREKLAAQGIMSSALLFVQPHYHKRWRETTEWKEKIKMQENQEVPQVLYLEKAPDTGIKTREERERAQED